MTLYRQSSFITEPQLENMVADYLEQVRKIIDQVNKENLLEIGCSNGFFLKKAKKYGFRNTWGIEPSLSAVTEAPQEIRDNILNEELKPGFFPDEHFDLICFFQVFDHISEPNHFLQIIYNYLKKGGMLLAIHHNIKAIMPTILMSRASTYDISHIYLYDKNTMRIILEKNGFKVLYIKNIANRYQLDHIMRMLPLPSFGKRPLWAMLRLFGLSNKSIKVSVENMVSVACKP